MKKTAFRLAGFGAGISLSSFAWAYPCASALSVYEFYMQSNQPQYAQEMVSNNPECFGGGELASRTQINATSFAQASAISSSLAMQQPMSGPQQTARTGLRGMAAGMGAGKWNAWSNLSLNSTSQSYTALNNFNSHNKNEITTGVLGVDYGLTPTVVLGLSAAYDDGNGRGRNDAPFETTNTTNSQGFLFAPYVGWQINQNLSLDASAGWGRGHLETDSATDARASRWFGAANLNYSRWLGNWQFAGRASYLHGVEDYGATRQNGVKFLGTGARNTLDQLRLSVQAGYWMGGVMPYVSLAYTNDVRRKTTQYAAPNNPIGRDGWLLGAGVNFFSLKDAVTGGVVYNQEFGRNHQNFHSLMANINLRF